MEKAKFPTKPFRNHGGASVPHNKRTSDKETRFLPTPPQVVIPMQMHIGAPAAPCVAVGDHVYVGQKIGETTSFVSAPIHASVSGTVKKITQIRMPNGSKCDAVFIDSDGLQESDPSIAPPVVNDAKDLLAAIKESGSVGLGGAGFPTHVKLNFPIEKADTLIINGAECEPYITSDHREILENSWNIMSAIYAIIDIIPFKRVIIGIEENKPDAIKMLNDIAESETNDPDDRVKVLKLNTRYPQGAEKMLIYACTKRIVPTGKLPLDAGCVVMNMTTLSFIGTVPSARFSGRPPSSSPSRRRRFRRRQ